MRRFTPRDLTLYLLLALMLVFTFSTLQQMDREDSPTYREILTCFYQERVEYFTLKDNTLTLTLRGNQESGSATVTYQVARPDWLYQTSTSCGTASTPRASCWAMTSPRGWRAPGGTT